MESLYRSLLLFYYSLHANLANSPLVERNVPHYLKFRCNLMYYNGKMFYDAPQLFAKVLDYFLFFQKRQPYKVLEDRNNACFFFHSLY